MNVSRAPCSPRLLDVSLLLALVDLDVPLAPDLGGREHAAGTAHVTEGGLTGTVSTTTGDTGDTGDSATYDSIISIPSIVKTLTLASFFSNGRAIWASISISNCDPPTHIASSIVDSIRIRLVENFGDRWD